MFLIRHAMHGSSGKNLIQFGEFQLDAAKNVLRRGGEVVPLPLKAVEVLTVLVENRGDVVTKRELMERVWADAFVEDSVLTQNIYLLRKALQTNGDKSPIKTVPRRGYLFEGEVSGAGPPPAAEENEQRRGLPASSRAVAAAGVAVLLLAGAVGGFLYLRGGRQAASASGVEFPLKLRPPTGASGYKTVAVLPFGAADGGLGRSFAADLSVRLGVVNKFGVLPPAVLEEHTRHGVEARSDLAVRGEIEREADRYTAHVTLSDAGGGVVWSGEFESDNLIQLQDAAANGTAAAIVARMTQPERDLVARRLPTNAAAIENFRTGYALWRRRADGSAYLRRAIELDANYAPAYAILAMASATGGGKGSPQAAEAERLLRKAFSLDENLPDAYAVQGFLRIFHHRDWDGAELSLRAALQADANNVNARHWLGVLYSIRRRLDEAKAEMRKAIDIDPTNPTLWADLGQIHYFAGENEAAAEHINKALAIDPYHFFAKEYLTLLTSPAEPPDKEATLARLAADADRNAFLLPYVNVDPRYDGLRADPRFKDILRKINLAE